MRPIVVSSIVTEETLRIARTSWSENLTSTPGISVRHASPQSRPKTWASAQKLALGVLAGVWVVRLVRNSIARSSKPRPSQGQIERAEGLGGVEPLLAFGRPFGRPYCRALAQGFLRRDFRSSDLMARRISTTLRGHSILNQPGARSTTRSPLRFRRALSMVSISSRRESLASPIRTARKRARSSSESSATTSRLEASAKATMRPSRVSSIVHGVALKKAQVSASSSSQSIPGKRASAFLRHGVAKELHLHPEAGDLTL